MAYKQQDIGDRVCKTGSSISHMAKYNTFLYRAVCIGIMVEHNNEAGDINKALKEFYTPSTVPKRATLKYPDYEAKE